MARHPDKENRKTEHARWRNCLRRGGFNEKKTPWVGYTSGENVPKQNAQNVGPQGNGISVQRMKREIGVLHSQKNDMIWLTLTHELRLEHSYL